MPARESPLSPKKKDGENRRAPDSGVPLLWGSLRCKSKFWARNFNPQRQHPRHVSPRVQASPGSKLRGEATPHLAKPAPQGGGGEARGRDRGTYNTARNFKFWARDVHPTISQAQVPLLWGSLRYNANRNSGREISNSGPEMCTPLFLRPKSKPVGREKAICVAPIRVVTKYPTDYSSNLCPPKIWCFGPASFLFLVQKAQKKTLEKSYRSYFKRAQIRWVIWRSSRKFPWEFPGRTGRNYRKNHKSYPKTPLFVFFQLIFP